MGDLGNGVPLSGAPVIGNGKTIDPAAAEMLEIASIEGYSTAFSRADSMKPCPIGAEGACCRVCYMGPCRLVGKNQEVMTGICGATLPTIVARNFARAVAAGTVRPLRSRPRPGDDACSRRPRARPRTTRSRTSPS